MVKMQTLFSTLHLPPPPQNHLRCSYCTFIKSGGPFRPHRNKVAVYVWYVRVHGSVAWGLHLKLIGGRSIHIYNCRPPRHHTNHPKKSFPLRYLDAVGAGGGLLHFQNLIGRTPHATFCTFFIRPRPAHFFVKVPSWWCIVVLPLPPAPASLAYCSVGST